jgi:N-acetylmuramoyl-L-alanine amidase
MKKILYIIIIIFILPFFQAAAFSPSYEQPGILIITHPEARFRETSAPRMSILGAADTSAPLYMNGEPLMTTDMGFFTAYVELEIGENEFTFVNGGYIETIIITRNEIVPGDWTPPVTEYYSFIQYGATEYTNISRFAELDDDRHMRTPLARLTTFRVLGEHGDFYIIEDGTAVFKSNVYLLDYARPPVIMTNERVVTHERGVFVSYEVNEYPLYEVELADDKRSAILTVYASEILNREFAFREPVIGFSVRFEGGLMNIDFRFPPRSLEGAVVLLDAGHGGSDPGALGPPSEFGPMEKDFNLYVARVARDYLEALGVTVIFIRPDDVRVDIFERMEYFTTHSPDIAVSVHANSMPLSSDFSSMRGPLMFITVDLSERAAGEMLRLIAAETGNEYMPPVRQNFAMARYTGGPSMLFEMGFLCNPEEYEAMLAPGYLTQMGVSLARAIAAQLVDEPPEEEPPPPAMIEYDEEDIVEAALMVSVDVASSSDLDRTINTFAAVIISMLFIGAALFLPNREALMKGKRR